MMQLKPAVALTSEYLALITLAEAKAWLRVQHDDENAVIEAIILSSIQFIENHCGVDFVRKRREVTFDSHTRWGRVPDFGLYDGRLPFGPRQEIVTALRLIPGQTPVTLTTSDYTVSGSGYLAISFNSYYSTRNAGMVTYSVTYDSGYLPGDNIADMKLAAQKLISSQYRNRSAYETGTIVAQLPLDVAAVLKQYKRNPILS